MRIIIYCMEACFRHEIKNKKGNCDILSHSYDFFHAIASLHLKFTSEI